MMNAKEHDEALDRVEAYILQCKTKEEIDRGIAMVIEIEEQYIDYLTYLIEEVLPERNHD